MMLTHRLWHRILQSTSFRPDLGLPDMTGYELMQRIRQRIALKGIAMSGYGMEEDIKRASRPPSPIERWGSVLNLTGRHGKLLRPALARKTSLPITTSPTPHTS